MFGRLPRCVVVGCRPVGFCRCPSCLPLPAQQPQSELNGAYRVSVQLTLWRDVDHEQRLTRRRFLRRMRLWLVVFYAGGIAGLVVLSNRQRVVVGVGLSLILALDVFLVTTIAKRLPADDAPRAIRPVLRARPDGSSTRRSRRDRRSADARAAGNAPSQSAIDER
jgi:hypothetical protein